MKAEQAQLEAARVERERNAHESAVRAKLEHDEAQWQAARSEWEKQRSSTGTLHDVGLYAGVVGGGAAGLFAGTAYLISEGEKQGVRKDPAPSATALESNINAIGGFETASLALGIVAGVLISSGATVMVLAPDPGEFPEPKPTREVAEKELSPKVGVGPDALVQPVMTTTPTDTTRPPPQKPAMSSRVAERFAIERVDVCVSKEDASHWWFCRHNDALTENAFVRDYRALTGAHDLDQAETNRAPGAWVIPTGGFVLAGVSVAAGGGTLLCGPAGLCGEDTKKSLDLNTSPIAGAVLGFSALGFIAGLATGFVFFPGEATLGGTPEMHTLTEGEGRAAVGRYNDALRAKLEGDLGGA